MLGLIKNIERIRLKENVTLVEMADFLEVDYRTIREKINGNSDFKFKEAMAIRNRFFPEYDAEFLFSDDKSHAV